VIACEREVGSLCPGLLAVASQLCDGCDGVTTTSHLCDRGLLWGKRCCVGTPHDKGCRTDKYGITVAGSPTKKAVLNTLGSGFNTERSSARGSCRAKSDVVEGHARFRGGAACTRQLQDRLVEGPTFQYSLRAGEWTSRVSDLRLSR